MMKEKKKRVVTERNYGGSVGVDELWRALGR